MSCLYGKESIEGHTTKTMKTRGCSRRCFSFNTRLLFIPEQLFNQDSDANPRIYINIMCMLFKYSQISIKFASIIVNKSEHEYFNLFKQSNHAFCTRKYSSRVW